MTERVAERVAERAMHVVAQPVAERFVNCLRSRQDAISIAGATAATAWTIRVQAAEAWDAVRVVALPGASLQEVKRAAMAELMPDIDDIDGFVVKLRGIEIHNERASLEASGALDGSTLLVMSRRRRPVR
jgi:hypothetical protein